MDKKQELERLVDDAKKEVDRLRDRRSEDLGNSINYIENELQIEHLLGKIDGLNDAIYQLFGE